jgi:hypothetical protein
MDLAEIVYRLRQTLQARLERLGIGRVRPLEARGECGAPWVAPLPRDFDATRYQAAADAVLDGRFDVFALSGAPLGFPPRWNVDPKSGTRAPDAFGKSIDYRDERLVGDIKYLWEPNRHLQLVTLAQAWHLSGEERYAEGSRQLLESWFEQCPYPFGPNWTSSLELAVRLTNWAVAWQLLGGDRYRPVVGEDLEIHVSARTAAPVARRSRADTIPGHRKVAIGIGKAGRGDPRGTETIT